jgi:hypothetical protein
LWHRADQIKPLTNLPESATCSQKSVHHPANAGSERFPAEVADVSILAAADHRLPRPEEETGSSFGDGCLRSLTDAGPREARQRGIEACLVNSGITQEIGLQPEETLDLQSFGMPLLPRLEDATQGSEEREGLAG